MPIIAIKINIKINSIPKTILVHLYTFNVVRLRPTICKINAIKVCSLQSHWTALFSPAAGEWNGLTLWAPGAVHRFRNIAIKELDSTLKE